MVRLPHVVGIPDGALFGGVGCLFLVPKWLEREADYSVPVPWSRP